MNADIAAHLVLAVGIGVMALSSAFSLVLGYRHHHGSTRSDDLAAAACHVSLFLSMFLALTSFDSLSVALVWTVPGQAGLAFLTFRHQSPQAEKRIALNVRSSRRTPGPSRT